MNSNNLPPNGRQRLAQFQDCSQQQQSDLSGGRPISNTQQQNWLPQQQYYMSYEHQFQPGHQQPHQQQYDSQMMHLGGDDFRQQQHQHNYFDDQMNDDDGVIVGETCTVMSSSPTFGFPSLEMQHLQSPPPAFAGGGQFGHHQAHNQSSSSTAYDLYYDEQAHYTMMVPGGSMPHIHSSHSSALGLSGGQPRQHHHQQSYHHQPSHGFVRRATAPMAKTPFEEEEEEEEDEDEEDEEEGEAAEGKAEEDKAHEGLTGNGGRRTSDGSGGSGSAVGRRTILLNTSLPIIKPSNRMTVVEEENKPKVRRRKQEFEKSTTTKSIVGEQKSKNATTTSEIFERVGGVRVEVKYEEGAASKKSAKVKQQQIGTAAEDTSPPTKNLVDKGIIVTQTAQRLGTIEGWRRMNGWLKTVIKQSDVTKLKQLLSQLSNADVSVDLLREDVDTPKLVKNLQKSDDKGIATMATNLVNDWKQKVRSEKSAMKAMAPPHKLGLDKKAAVPSPATAQIGAASKGKQNVPRREANAANGGGNTTATVSSTTTTGASLAEKTNVAPPPAAAVKPKTPAKAKIRLSKPRLTGLEGDDEEKTTAAKAQPEKGGKNVQQSPAGSAISPNFESPLTRIFSATNKFHAQNRAVQPKRKSVEVMFSDNFMDSLCGPSEDAATAPTKKSKIIRKKLSATVKADSKRDSVEEGNNSSSGAIGVGGEKRRVRFSDEFGIELTQTRFFEVEEGERVNVTKMHLSREELKHFDSQREKIMLQQHHQFGTFSLTDPTLMPPGHHQPFRPPPPPQNACRVGMATTSAAFPATMASGGGGQMGKFGRGMESLFLWKLPPVDDAIALIVSGCKSHSKNIEAKRIHGVMEAICLPEICLPISDIDEHDYKQHQNETIDHVPKIIPLEMIGEGVPSEPQQLDSVEMGTEATNGGTMKKMEFGGGAEDREEGRVFQRRRMEERRKEWEEEEEEEDRYSPEPPVFTRFDEQEEDNGLMAIGSDRFSQKKALDVEKMKGEEEEKEEEDDGMEVEEDIVIIDDDDDSPPKETQTEKGAAISSSSPTMEHGPASPEQMDESTDSIQLVEIPTEAMETEEEEEDLDIRVLQSGPAPTTTGGGDGTAPEAQVSSVSPSAMTNEQKSAAGVDDDLSKVQAFLRKGGVNSSLLQRISSMVGSTVGGTQQPSQCQPLTTMATQDTIGEPKICLSAPVTPSKPVDQFEGSSSSSGVSVSLSCPSSVASSFSTSAGGANRLPLPQFGHQLPVNSTTIAGSRFPPPAHPLRPIVGPIGNVAFPLPDFSKPPPTFISPPSQLRPAQFQLQTSAVQQQNSPGESPKKTPVDDASTDPSTTNDSSEGKTMTSPGPPGMDEGRSPPQASTEQQKQQQQDEQQQQEQQKEMHPLLDREEARALVGPCPFFMRHNTCKFGDRCKFAHGEDTVTFGVQMAMRGVKVAFPGRGARGGGRGAFVGRGGGFRSVGAGDDRRPSEEGVNVDQNANDKRLRRRGTSGRYISPIRSSASDSRFDRRFRASPDRTRYRRRSRTRSRSRDRYGQYNRRRRSRDRRRKSHSRDRSRSRDHSRSRDRSRTRDRTRSRDRGKTRSSSSSSSSSSSTRTYSSRSATPPANSS